MIFYSDRVLARKSRHGNAGFPSVSRSSSIVQDSVSNVPSSNLSGQYTKTLRRLSSLHSEQEADTEDEDDSDSGDTVCDDDDAGHSPINRPIRLNDLNFRFIGPDDDLTAADDLGTSFSQFEDSQGSFTTVDDEIVHESIEHQSAASLTLSRTQSIDYSTFSSVNGGNSCADNIFDKLIGEDIAVRDREAKLSIDHLFPCLQD